MNIKKIIANKGLLILGVFLLINMFCVKCFCDTTQDIAQSVTEIKQRLSQENIYSLKKKLDLFNGIVDTSGTKESMLFLIKDQIREHERLASQIYGLIQSGNLKGNINPEGKTFIEVTIEDTGKKTLLSTDEFSTQSLQELINNTMNSEQIPTAR